MYTLRLLRTPELTRRFFLHSVQSPGWFVLLSRCLPSSLELRCDTVRPNPFLRAEKLPTSCCIPRQTEVFLAVVDLLVLLLIEDVGVVQGEIEDEPHQRIEPLAALPADLGVRLALREHLRRACA